MRLEMDVEVFSVWLIHNVEVFNDVVVFCDQI